MCVNSPNQSRSFNSHKRLTSHHASPASHFPFSLYCSQLDKLQIVDVKDMFIDHADDPPSSIGEMCAAVRSLDLSANLIHSWKTVYDIATHLPHLSVLRLRSVHPQPQTIVS